jgi:hypothetical protein
MSVPSVVSPNSTRPSFAAGVPSAVPYFHSAGSTTLGFTASSSGFAVLGYSSTSFQFIVMTFGDATVMNAAPPSVPAASNNSNSTSTAFASCGTVRWMVKGSASSRFQASISPFAVTFSPDTLLIWPTGRCRPGIHFG